MDTRDLSPEIAPPDGLEERTVARLRQEGLLRSPRPRWHLVAAAVVLFASGAAAGGGWRAVGDSSTTDPRFLLLLHDGPGITRENEEPAVDAYRRWAAELRQEGRFVTGERLARDTVIVPSGPVKDVGVSGFFIVSAPNLADAIALAGSAPHVARGRQFTVRPIDTP